MENLEVLNSPILEEESERDDLQFINISKNRHDIGTELRTQHEMKVENC